MPEKLFSLLSKELEIEVKAGRVKNISLLDIILTVISLNLTLFTILPIATNIIDLDENKLKFLLAHRKAENVDIVLSYLRP